MDNDLKDILDALDYPMDKLEDIYHGQCQVCTGHKEINHTKDVDMLRFHYKGFSQVFDTL